MTFNATLNDTLDLGGGVRFPPDPKEGVATVEFGGKIKIDEQRPHGKDDPKLTTVGREGRTVSITLEWTHRIDAAARAVIRLITPVGVNQGKAWEINHPDAELYAVDALEFDSIGKMTHEASFSSVTLTAKSWKKSALAQTGKGATTPTKTVDDHVYWQTKEGNTIDLGSGPVSFTTSSGTTIGFNQGSDTAPKAKVP